MPTTPSSQLRLPTQQKRTLPPVQPKPHETVRVVLCGSYKGVTAIIHQLHCAGFAEAGAWCKPQPVRSQNGKYISLNIKKFRRQEASRAHAEALARIIAPDPSLPALHDAPN